MKKEKKSIQKNLERSIKEIKKVNRSKNSKNAKTLQNEKLLKGKIEKEIEILIDFLFNTLKDKTLDVINFNSLSRAIVNNDLISKIDLDKVEKMINLFDKNGNIDQNSFKEIFRKTKMNMKPFINKE